MSGIEAAFFGVLGRDAEVKTSQAGRRYLRLNVRVGDGDSAQWVSAMVFDEQALEAVDRLVKGARVYIEGRISIGEWTGQNGAQRHGLSVLSWHCRLSQIGRNRPRRERADGEAKIAAAARRDPVRRSETAELDDPIGF
jgi:single-stranded DNA-binding protein